MKKLLAFLAMTCFLQPVAKAQMAEVHTPAEMVSCMQNYIENWIVAPDSIGSWEHRPAYIFAGSYFHASWHTKALMQYGSFSLMLGPTAPITCKYETDLSGLPDWNSGTCTATVANGDVEFELDAYDRPMAATRTLVKIARISQNKILCYNIARP